MSRIFTPLLKFAEINTSDIDPFADAFGYEYLGEDILRLLSQYEIEPGDECIQNLLKKIA